MNLNKFLAVCGLGVTLIINNNLWAAQLSSAYGWYAEGNVGATRLIQNNYPENSNWSNTVIGANVDVGYKFMPYFGAEIGYTHFANINIENNTNTQAGTARYYSYDLAGKGIIPVGGTGFEFFGKFGVQRIYSNISITNSSAANDIGLTSGQSSTTGYYLGAGGQYYLAPELAVVVQWARSAGNSSTGTLDLYSLGLSYIF